MSQLKLVTIGGGSSYTPELIEGLIKRYAEFPVSEIWLVDVEEGKEKLTREGKIYLLEMPLKANIALIKAWKADTYGNLVYQIGRAHV